jgi:hypothetical protein
MSGRIKKYADVGLRLELRKASTQGRRFSHGNVEVFNFEVKVHHGPLVVRCRWPYGRDVALGSLEDQEDRTLRRLDYSDVIFLVHHRPIEQP